MQYIFAVTTGSPSIYLHALFNRIIFSRRITCFVSTSLSVCLCLSSAQGSLPQCLCLCSLQQVCLSLSVCLSLFCSFYEHNFSYFRVFSFSLSLSLSAIYLSFFLFLSLLLYGKIITLPFSCQDITFIVSSLEDSEVVEVKDGLMVRLGLDVNYKNRHRNRRIQKSQYGPAIRKIILNSYLMVFFIEFVKNNEAPVYLKTHNSDP